MISETVFCPIAGQTILSMVEIFARLTGYEPARLAYHRTMRGGPLCSNSMPCGGLPVKDLFAGAFGDGAPLVLSHSPVSLLTHDASPEKAARVVNSLASGLRGLNHCPRMPTGVACGNRSSLRCPECSSHALETCGFRPALREHVFDHVTRCAFHECLLTSAAAWSRLEASLCEATSDGTRRNALRYSSCISGLLQDGPQQPLWDVVVIDLRCKRFITPDGHCRLAALDHAFRAFYSAGFEDVRLTWLIESRSVPEMCVRAADRGRPIHPVLLALMYMFAREVGDVSQPHPLRHEPAYTASPDVALRDAKRRQWECHRESSPGLTRKQMRLGMPAIWTWLYRHDRAWLEEHQVARGKPRGGRTASTLPTPFLDAIRTSAADFRYSNAGREPLPSSYQLRLGLGMNEYTFERISRALGIGSAAPLPARREVFVTRRVDRAHFDLGSHSTSALSVIARAAKLRPETVAACDQRY